MSFLKNLILIIAVAFLGGLFYWALFVPKQEISQKIVDTFKEQQQRADLAFKKVSFEENVGGVRYWQLTAATAMVNKDQGVASLQQAEGLFYKNGKPALKFRSPSALWDMKKKEIYLDKPFGYDVALESKIQQLVRTIKESSLSIFNLPEIYKKQPGYWFQAKNLGWKLANQQIVCSGGIVLNKGEISGHAEKLTGDVALEKVILEGNPYIEINQPHSAPVTIEANSFELDSLTDTLLAKGSPHIRWAAARVDAGQIQYLQAQKKFDLSQQVKLNYTDIKATGQTAFYLVKTQQFILSGEAFAEQDQNRLNGDKIMVSMKDKKISLLGRSRVKVNEEDIKP